MTSAEEEWKKSSMPSEVGLDVVRRALSVAWLASSVQALAARARFSWGSSSRYIGEENSWVLDDI